MRLRRAQWRTRHRRLAAVTLAVIALGVLLLPLAAAADPVEETSPVFGFLGQSDLTTSVKLVLFFSALALLPAAVVSVTAFTRVVVVLGFLRQAVGVQGIPPNPVMMGIAMMLSIYIMSPVFTRIHTDAIAPLLNNEITEEQAMQRGAEPLRRFMLHHTRQKDLALFVQLAQSERPDSPDDIPLQVLVPGFLISELRTAFQIGFMLFLPFLVIDMVIASVLMSMGMMMLPPVVVSLPFKILLFVLVDGWNLVARGLVNGFS